jgi:hypothetical protein
LKPKRLSRTALRQIECANPTKAPSPFEQKTRL